MRPCRTKSKSCVEVELKSGIEYEISIRHFRDVDTVISLSVDFSEIVFVQEVVRDYETFFVISERNVVRAGVCAEV